MRSRSLYLHLAACIAAGLSHVPSGTAAEGYKLIETDTAYLKFTGRLQAQYYRVDPDIGEDSENGFFRRVTPTLEAGVGSDWFARLQVELMTSTGERDTTIKDAYAQYKGIEGCKLSLGNAAFPFSREYLTSAERQQFVERMLTGSRSYGVPYRNAGVHLTGESGDTRFTYGVSVARATINPDAGKIAFDSPVNDINDFNRGWIAGGRVDYHPFGKLAFSQGDFAGDTRATIGAGTYVWHNTGGNAFTDSDGHSTSAVRNDVDRVQAMGLSGAWRYQGISMDAGINRFSADAVDGGFTGGLYDDGHAVLRTCMIKGGYMLIADRLELTVGWQGASADAWDKTWTGKLLGANLFLNRHDLKLQTTYQRGNNVRGKTGNDQDEWFVQIQAVY